MLWGVGRKGLNMHTRTLDLGGIPEPIARGLEVVAEMARHTTQAPTKMGAIAPVLPVWPLGVVGDLTRAEIYDDDAHESRC